MSEPPTAGDPFGEILPEGELAHAPGSELPLSEFKPWHMPRKQFVRNEQWAKALESLLAEIPDRRVVKYFCLPGEDLLDVEVVNAVCKKNGRTLKYLGFDYELRQRQRSTQRVAAEQILRQTSSVEATSEVVPDLFESIAHKDSRGSRYLRDGGSYDIVNLDLCDCFTSDGERATHDAVVELLTHQCNKRAEPWLLFITTRAELDRVAPAELRAYAGCISNNASLSEEFRGHFTALTGIEDLLDVERLLASLSARLNGDAQLSGKVLTLGIGKWLLKITAQKDPWRADLLSTWCYRTGMEPQEKPFTGKPNLFSLAFRFEKIRVARHDETGLATRHPEGPATENRFAKLNESALAAKMVKHIVASTMDVDCRLQKEIALRSTLLEECVSLLRVRNYAVEAYRAWVNGLPPIECPPDGVA